MLLRGITHLIPQNAHHTNNSLIIAIDIADKHTDFFYFEIHLKDAALEQDKKYI